MRGLRWIRAEASVSGVSPEYNKIAEIFRLQRSWEAPQVGLEPTTTRLTAECSAIELLRNMESGSDLSSRAVSSQVLSALKGLTSVFGMGTGGTPSSLPPEMVSYFIVSTCFRFRLSHCITFQSPCQALLCSFLYPDNCTTFMIQCPDRFPISLFVFAGFTGLSSAVIKPSTY